MVMHRDAADALACAGADPVQVADHLVLGATRDVQAVDGFVARDAAAGGPSVSVDPGRAESLPPGGHPDPDRVSGELVESLFRSVGSTPQPVAIPV